MSTTTIPIAKIAEVKIPFGKYEGSRLGDIPMPYLNSTISVMPDEWIVRCAKRIVDEGMYIFSGYVNFYQGRVINATYNQMADIERKTLEDKIRSELPEETMNKFPPSPEI